MDIKEFLEKFAEQFDDTDSSVFTPETEFRNLDEWSSIMALSILAMIDDEYNVTLKSDEMRQAKTIKELYDLVHSK